METKRALDAKLREYMWDELRKLQQRLGITSLDEDGVAEVLERIVKGDNF